MGAAGFGVLAQESGYPAAFALTAMLMLAVLAAGHARRPSWTGTAVR